ncbi:MAG: GAF domain-containing protein, partial [Cyanobacteria bacterium]|nr:GAF domain-containing protein [Cyanobacteriota bacterium]
MDGNAMMQALQAMQGSLDQVGQAVETGGCDRDGAVIAAIAQLQAQLTTLQAQVSPLAGSVQLATAVLTVMPDLLYRVGRDGICRDNFVRNIPWDISQVENPVGLHLRQILPLAMADRHLAHVDKALTTGTIQCYEQETALGDTVQYDEVRIVPYGSDEALIIVRDISDRKQAEQSRNQAVNALQQLNVDLEARVEQRTAELRQQEQQLTEFFDNAHDLLQSVNLNTGHFEYVNRAWLSTLGYTEAEVADLTIFEVLHPHCHPHCQQVAADLLAGKQDSLSALEMTFVTKDGREVMLEGSITCHTNEAGHLLTRGIFRDVSDHRRTAIALQRQVEREQLLRQISQRIRQSLDLQTIFDTACTEIRQLLGVDRVGIFKFYPESHYDDGEFVAEAGVADIPSVLAVRVHDHCFGDNYAHLYAQGRYYAVEDIYSNGLEPCHSGILAQFQVRANLVMPLLCGAELWGLLCIHQCHGPRTWGDPEVSLTREISHQLAIAIQQASFYAQSQRELAERQRAEAQIAQQLRQQEALGQIIQHIRQSLNLEDILTTVTWQVQSLLGADRVIVFRLFPDGRSRILEEAVVADLPQMRDRQWEDESFPREILDWYWQGQPRIVPDVMTDRWTDCLVDYSREGRIQSKMVAPILQELHGPENHR